MKTFIKQIEKACSNYRYFSIIKTMQIKSDYENTRVAIVIVRENEKDERHYRIYYKYNNMHKPDYIGRYTSLYNEKGECTYNAYIEACEEFTKFAN